MVNFELIQKLSTEGFESVIQRPVIENLTSMRENLSSLQEPLLHLPVEGTTSRVQEATLKL